MSNNTSHVPNALISRIKTQQALLGLSNNELALALGFEHCAALELIKRGVMKFPVTKVPALATALELDVTETLRLALHESDPLLLATVEQVFNPMNLTVTEFNLIKHLREISGDTPGVPLVFEGRKVIALVAI